jgi:hypothetical protein
MKSDNLKKVRQRTAQMIKRQEAQKELQGDGREKEASREKRLLCQPMKLRKQHRTRDQEAVNKIIELP